jgi:hypothetical protein
VGSRYKFCIVSDLGRSSIQHMPCLVVLHAMWHLRTPT